jgi:hypothetical protein
MRKGRERHTERPKKTEKVNPPKSQKTKKRDQKRKPRGTDSAKGGRRIKWTINSRQREARPGKPCESVVAVRGKRGTQEKSVERQKR